MSRVPETVARLSRRAPAAARTRRVAAMASRAIFTRAWTRRCSPPISSAPQREAKALRKRWRGKLAAIAAGARRRRALAEAVSGYEALQDLIGPGHVLRLAALRLRHERRGAGEILRRRAGAGDRARRRPPVLRARAQPARRRDARGRDGGAGARPLSPVARGHPQGEAAPARRRHRAAVPGEVRLRRGRVEPPVRRHDVGAAVRRRRREPDARADARASSRTRTRPSARRRPTRSPRRSAPTCASSR